VTEPADGPARRWSLICDIIHSMSDATQGQSGSARPDELATSHVIDSNELVARNVRRYREERRLSLGELARRAGLSKQTLSKIELGIGNPTVGTVAAIANALGLSLRRLLTEWGSQVYLRRAGEAVWVERGAGSERQLDKIYGSGDVRTTMLRLKRPTSSRTKGKLATPPLAAHARGVLHHCLVLSGSVRLGPAEETAELDTGDFVRFPGDTAHIFQSLTPEATIHLLTTKPGVPQFQPAQDVTVAQQP